MRVARWSGALLAWESELSRLKDRIGPVFGRREVRETAGAFLDGLLSGVERKTGWLLAEQAGLEHPTRMQALLGRTRWEADALRDQVRAYVLEALGDPDGVLVVDETGFVKKGVHSVGVARQYSGTAGRIESCQVGVFLAYASRFGQALIDRRLYLPEAWAGDAERRAQASVPAEVSFATKPAMARELVGAALEAGVPCAFVLADALYGSDTQLRRMLEERGQPYVLAVRSNHHLRFLEGWTVVQTDPATLADELSPEAWVPHAAGEGAKGLRLYDWATIPLSWTHPDKFERFLVVRPAGVIRSVAPTISSSVRTGPRSPSLPMLQACAGRSSSCFMNHANCVLGIPRTQPSAKVVLGQTPAWKDAAAGPPLGPCRRSFRPASHGQRARCSP